MQSKQCYMNLLRFFTQGTLRVLLVLLHDFPEFLCDYHYAFCDVIPPNCIQMRNLILSAFPRNMRLPDPFTPNLKVGYASNVEKKIGAHFAVSEGNPLLYFPQIVKCCDGMQVINTYLSYSCKSLIFS